MEARIVFLAKLIVGGRIVRDEFLDRSRIIYKKARTTDDDIRDIVNDESVSSDDGSCTSKVARILEDDDKLIVCMDHESVGEVTTASTSRSGHDTTGCEMDMRNMGENQRAMLATGLTSSPKYIPTWYNYDDTGSKLHDECTTGNSGNNYFTRSQMSVLQNNIQDIIPRVPHEMTLVDLGSGNCSKTRLFIDELLRRQQKCSFYPVDISAEFLLKSVSELSNEYGDALSITPIPLEFEQGIEQLKKVEGPKLILFFSTIIIMPYEDQVNTLRMISSMMTDKCRLVFSADVTQERDTILKAYNTGVARTFLTNVVTRLNREEGSQIDMDMFTLEVDFISDISSHNMSYVSVYIQAKEAVQYPIPALDIQLTMAKGERLYFHKGAGYSCKYTLEQLRNIVQKAGLRMADTWTDEQQRAIFCQCTNVNDIK